MEDVYWVCVLYNTRPIDSLTLNSLAKIFERDKYVMQNILIYDNSLYSTKEVGFFSSNVNLLFIHDPNNSGLAKAYNIALCHANRLGKKWLVLLDQDTVLSTDFENELKKSIKFNYDQENIVGIIPKVYHGNLCISPTRLFFNVFNRQFKFKDNQVLTGSFSAINSGSALSVNFLNSINGFNEQFPIDLLDHWLFYSINLLNKKVFLSQAKIQHSLSLLQGNVSDNRYKSILTAEKLLIYRIKKKKVLYVIVILLRIMKLFLKGQFKFVKLTLEFIFKANEN